MLTDSGNGAIMNMEIPETVQYKRKICDIVPETVFQKTKEDCKAAYRRLNKRAFFTPGEFKNEEYLERFRGIYLPFWTYSFTQKGHVSLQGTRESGNYTEYLDLSCDLDASYDGISYDASSAFNDELCSYITPFNRSSIREFLPTYLGGFYADATDVESDVYRTDAEKDANEETLKKLGRQYGKVRIQKPKDLSKRLHTKLTDVIPALYPVWFLTYRNNDRVAYAVMNGETGKIAADLPVDNKKFLLGSLILAFPIFLILCLLPTITAQNLTVTAVILAVAAFVLYLLSSREIRRRELRLDDKGYQAKRKQQKGRGREDSEAGIGTESAGSSVPKIRDAGEGRKENRPLNFLRSALPLIGALLGLLIRITNPVSDIYYYGGAIIVLICICITLSGLIGRFNLLTTRPIPEFHDREGGDDRA